MKIQCLENDIKNHISPVPMKKIISGSKVKVGVLSLVQQPGTYWDRSSALPLVGLGPTEMTVYD